MANDDGVYRRGPVGLHEHELQALVILVRVLVGLDHKFTEGEADSVSSIALEVGEESFWTHMQASYDQELRLESALELAKKVERQEARNAVFVSLADLASADGISVSEQGLLTRLEQLWDINPTEAS
ncbi:MAG: hypothetical protein KJO07_17320 [Deltaproteobacteria bacterium]|nr:hypothetical protein [Deltaproteobacteria bacterium]